MDQLSSNVRALTALSETVPPRLTKHPVWAVARGTSSYKLISFVLHASLFFIDSGIVDLFNVTPHLRGLSEGYSAAVIIAGVEKLTLY
jgi:hypothetical protein